MMIQRGDGNMPTRRRTGCDKDRPVGYPEPAAGAVSRPHRSNRITLATGMCDHRHMP